MKIIKEIIGFMLMAGRLFRRTDDTEILSVYFHNPNPKLFSKLINWLVRQGYDFISAGQLDEIISSGQHVTRKAIITFDDGNKEYLDLLDIINTYKVPITIFIPVEPVQSGNYWWDFAADKDQGKYTGLGSVEDFKKLKVEEFDLKMDILKNSLKLKRTCVTMDELLVLAKNPYVTIGSHTVTHPILKNCGQERQRDELRNSKNWLDEKLMQHTQYLAYPNGDYDETTLTIAAAEKYRLGFTTKPGRINLKNLNRLEIPRYAVNDEGGYFENLAKINGLWQAVFN
ncbi:polysaccharide deacetylase family protein [Flavihumibacter fluvii]|uniref:polysaccharide deacetylase family protein n=1 Tax=Flavihumibacter fluvii TaxID=2838157 RepID=UPI001BDE7C5B|nr:polysaccharide deacetylase family protein [Flavihumibacter fluvii]ULQ54438.1 polysaccharide deacetylase family protein [Flavihumibacter fluvii]